MCSQNNRFAGAGKKRNSTGRLSERRWLYFSAHVPLITPLATANRRRATHRVAWWSPAVRAKEIKPRAPNITVLRARETKEQIPCVEIHKASSSVRLAVRGGVSLHARRVSATSPPPCRRNREPRLCPPPTHPHGRDSASLPHLPLYPSMSLPRYLSNPPLVLFGWAGRTQLAGEEHPRCAGVCPRHSTCAQRPASADRRTSMQEHQICGTWGASTSI